MIVLPCDLSKNGPYAFFVEASFDHDEFMQSPYVKSEIIIRKI